MVAIMRARRLVRASVAVLIVAFSAPALADQSKPSQTITRPAYELVGTTIRALTLAASIEQAIDRIDRSRLGDRGGRFEATTQARQALDRSREAGGLFSRPFGANNDPLRRSAGNLRNAFNAMSMGFSDAISLWDKLSLSVEESEVSDIIRSSEAKLIDERPWQMLQKATQDLSLALLDVGRAPVPGDVKTARHLRLTRSEREIVIAQLTTAFPGVTTGGRAGIAGGAAAELHAFLTRPYAAEDEP
jgi:hypothetical protein